MLIVFPEQSLPTSNEVELPDAVRREVNSAMQKGCEAVDKPESTENDPFAGEQ